MQPQPGVTVVTTAAAPILDDDKFRPAALSQMRVLSILQIVIGVICAVFGIVLVCVFISGTVMDIVYGAWIGVYFILVGGIGLGAVKSNSSCWIISAMILNIICSSFVTILLLIFAAVGIVHSEDFRNYYCSYLGHYNNFYKGCVDDELVNTGTALNSIMIIFSVVEFIITVWCSALCCGAVCRCCETSAGGQIIQQTAVPMNQPQVVTYTTAPPGGVSYPTGQPMPVQGQYYPMAAQQQPVGYVVQPQPQAPPAGYPVQPQPQAPPTYYPPPKQN